jgi:hypothetical protein
MYNVLSQAVATDVSPVIATWETHPNLFNASAPLTSLLSKQEHIASHERELLKLCNKKANPITHPSGPSNREPNVNIVDDQQPRKRILFPEVIITRIKLLTEELETHPQPLLPVGPSPPATENAEAHDHSISHPHPFGNAQEATYLLLTDWNFATAPKPLPVKKTEPTYKTFPPVYNGKITIDVYDRMMAAQVTLTQCELLSLSRSLCTSP